MLEIGDHCRNRRLGNAELLGGFGHAAALNDRQEHMEIPELQSAADPARPIDFSEHNELIWGVELNREFRL
jgi:hypothetical protein